jgi:hypothetical protein
LENLCVDGKVILRHIEKTGCEVVDWFSVNTVLDLWVS